MREKVEERTHFSWDVKVPLLKETDHRCAHCGTPLNRYTNLTIDHVIPLNKGGTNDPENLTVLCEDCNTEKSDMILSPAVWYPYLCKAKKKLLMDRMQKYMKETDYLAPDCLLPIDSFRIEVPVTTKKKKPNGYEHIIRMPVYIRGVRIDRDKAFAWLMEYKKSLQYRDAVGVINHPSDFPSPCYLLKKGEIDVAMANPWMIHEYDEKIGNYRNEIVIDWFFHPKLPNRDYIPEMLACMISGLQEYILGCISKTTEGAGTVLLRVRCFVSDRFCDPVFDLCERPHIDQIYEFGKNERLPSRVRELSMLMVVGDRKAAMELQNALAEKYPDGTMSIREAMEVSAALNKRFE